CFFFFQAEDGIRDRNVTGVQTCALPILRLSRTNFTGGKVSIKSILTPLSAGSKPTCLPCLPWTDCCIHRVTNWKRPTAPANTGRSEERRVGKEWQQEGRQGHAVKTAVQC